MYSRLVRESDSTALRRFTGLICIVSACDFVWILPCSSCRRSQSLSVSCDELKAATDKCELEKTKELGVALAREGEMNCSEGLMSVLAVKQLDLRT